MARTFTSAMTTALAKKQLTPIVLASFAFATGTVNLATETVTINSTTYNGLIATIGQVENINGESGPWGISIPAVTIRLVNSAAAPFSDYFKSNVARKTLVTLKQWFEDENLVEADITELDRYYIETYRHDELYCEIRLVNELYRKNKRIGTKLTATDYPGMDPDYIGRVANIIYGNTSEVRAVPVDAGAATTLCTAGGIDESQTTGIQISQGKRDTIFPTSGKLYIDDEEITYTGRTANDGYWTLTGVTRGTSGTTATTHDYATAVYSVSNLDGSDRSNYIYLLASHAVKSIGAVFVDNILQVGGYLAYTGQTGDNHPSGDYNGKAVIDFAAKPTISKQVNVNIVDGISVNDGADVTEPGHAHNTGAYLPNFGTGGSHTALGATWTGSGGSAVDAAMYDENKANTWLQGSDTSWNPSEYARVTFPAWSGGTINGVKKCIAYELAINSGTCQFEGTTLSATGTISGNNPVIAKFSTGTTWDQTISVTVSSGANLTIKIYQIWQEVDSDTSSNNSGVSKTGSVTKDGTVTLGASDNTTADLVIGQRIVCNVEGYKDDGSGTYTGTPSALIEIPADVIRHFAVVYAGLTVDTTRFGAARTSHSSASYTFAGVIREHAPVLDILTRMKNQCRLHLWDSRGSLRCRYIPDSPSADYTIDKAYMGLGSVSVTPTAKPELINTAQLHYDTYWGTLSDDPGRFYGLTDEATDATSVTDHGTCDLPPELAYCEWITNATMADSIRDDFIARYKDPMDRVPFTVGLDLLKAEEGDFIGVTHDATAYNYTTEVFMVSGPPAFMPGGIESNEQGATVRPPIIGITALEVQ